jgi:hypothetical protein
MVEAPAVKRLGGAGAGMPAKVSMLALCFFYYVCIVAHPFRPSNITLHIYRLRIDT